MSDSTPQKTCSKCGSVLPATPEHFYRNKGNKDGFDGQCIDCKKAYNRQYRKDNRQRLIDYNRVYREENLEAIKRQQQQYHEKNKEHRNKKSREYYQKNRESVLETQRQWRLAHKDYLREYNETYRRENLDRIKQQEKAYRQRPEVKKRRREVWQAWYERNKSQVHASARRRYWDDYRSEKRKRNQEWYRKNKPRYRVYASRRRARLHQYPDTFTTEQWNYCLDYFNHCCAVCGSQLRDLFGEVVPHADHWIPLSSDECTGTIATNMVCLCDSCNRSKYNKMPEEWLRENYSSKKAKVILSKINRYFDHIREISTG